MHSFRFITLLDGFQVLFDFGFILRSEKPCPVFADHDKADTKDNGRGKDLAGLHKGLAEPSEISQ